MINYHCYFESEKYYHVFNRGNNGDKIFESDRNYKYFLDKLQKYIIPFVDIYTYCLIPNHFHLLIRIKNDKNFDKFSKLNNIHIPEINALLEERFQRLFSSYALAFNKEQGRTGSLFEKRFKRINVDSDEYFMRLVHYIHNNPIHHKLVNKYSEWKYSSYNTIISDLKTKVKREEVIDWFGSKKDFVELHKQMINYIKIEHLIIE